MSSKKKNTSPPSRNANSVCGSMWLSKASGSKRRKAVANKAPAARLSRCCGPTPVRWFRPKRISKAAIQTLPIPATRVAMRMAIRVMSAVVRA